MKFSEREWTVLQALWQTDGAELGTLVNLLHPETNWSRNTVLTYLTRMETKGLVAIDKSSTPHIYRAVPDQESCRREKLRETCIQWFDRRPDHCVPERRDDHVRRKRASAPVAG